MKVYTGFRDRDGIARVSTTDGWLAMRQDLQNHSPDGPEWGYGGSGPAQLALALLADAVKKDDVALALHQHFKRLVVCGLHHDRWMMTDCFILGWVTGFCGGEVTFAPDRQNPSVN